MLGELEWKAGPIILFFALFSYFRFSWCWVGWTLVGEADQAHILKLFYFTFSSLLLYLAQMSISPSKDYFLQDKPKKQVTSKNNIGSE